MIVDFKYEYGDKTLPKTIKHRGKDIFNSHNMIFDPVNSINSDTMKHWEKKMEERGYPYAVYLVKNKTKSNGGFEYSYDFTMITKQEIITEINNPPDSEGIVEVSEDESDII